MLRSLPGSVGLGGMVSGGVASLNHRLVCCTYEHLRLHLSRPRLNWKSLGGRQADHPGIAFEAVH